MFNRLFGKKAPPAVIKPSIMGLAVGTSFDVDPLSFKLILDHLVIETISTTQNILSAGQADMDGNTLLRFYTDDDAWLQVVCESEISEDHIIDVKLFHYYDTQSIDNQQQWDTLLNQEMGQATYSLEGHLYQRVWSSVGRYAMPVPVTETTYDKADTPTVTDQFMMLFERELPSGDMEFLMLSAEECRNTAGDLERCLVISTGVNLTPAQLTVNG